VRQPLYRAPVTAAKNQDHPERGRVSAPRSAAPPTSARRYFVRKRARRTGSPARSARRPRRWRTSSARPATARRG